MPSFLSNVVHDILEKEKSISNLTFILPSKRAGTFLKQELKKKIDKPTIFPKVLSIEDFIYELSSITLLDNITLLFEFYSIYVSLTEKSQIESFDKFSNWASIALQDFNEIDRHLVDTHYIFDYLKSIDRLKNWNIKKGSETKLINDHLTFFERLEVYYHKLYDNLSSRKFGYQGIQYREAVENLQSFIENNQDKEFVFVGFNALNKAEETIIQELLANELAIIYWDIDSYYFNDHPASIFLRKYKNNWNYFKKNSFNWIKNNLNKEKNIQVIGSPKNNSQIKYVGEILEKIKGKESNFQNTALVLADESLLPLTLNSFPKSIKHVNITMGYDLKNMSISSLIETLFKLHTNTKNNAFYYKNVIAVLNHPLIKKIVSTDQITNLILKHNYIFFNKSTFLKLTKKLAINAENISFLFDDWQNNANIAIKNCVELITILKDKTNSKLEREFLFKNLTILNQLEQLNTKFNYIKTIKTLNQLFNQLIKNEKLSFQGEPLSGLQLMGMLETRVLDFENVIVTSVNEGILPAGKSNNSFIPFDVKKDLKVNLPTYQERDAIFSYHFYRLIQRAKNVYLLYNTENDQYGSGEKSRFITELEINKPEAVQASIVSPKVISEKSELKQIDKTTSIITRLKELAKKGFSPTSLTNYINNPIKFYEQKILNIKEREEAEETIAANTLGTIIHKTLESFYLPFKGKLLKTDDVVKMKKKTPLEVKKWFTEEYTNGDISTGKNLLIYNVAQQFILNFLNSELKLLNEGKQLKILELEYNLETEILIDDLSFPVKLIGQADRIDELDGVLRIIDYKTGKVEQKDLTVKDWSLITSDYKKYSKSFQVLLYALMYAKMNNFNFDSKQIESGIISFKNLKAGFMKVNKGLIMQEDINRFTQELKNLLLDIFNQNIPFIENDDKYF